MPKARRVWIVEYDHKHGTDIMLYTTRKAAERGIINVMLKYLRDLPSSCLASFTEMLADRDVDALMSFWSEHADEFFRISFAPVTTYQEARRGKI